MVCVALQSFESLVNDGWSLHHCWQLNFIFISSKGSEKFEIKKCKQKCPTVAIQNVREKSKKSNFYQICIARDLCGYQRVQTLQLGCCMLLPACNECFQKLRNSSFWIEVNWFLTDSPQVWILFGILSWLNLSIDQLFVNSQGCACDFVLNN